MATLDRAARAAELEALERRDRATLTAEERDRMEELMAETVCDMVEDEFFGELN